MDKQNKSGLSRLLTVFVVGLVVASGTGAAISYFKGQPASLSFVGAMIWGLIAFIFVMSVVLYRMFPRFMRCSECGRPASDVLIHDGTSRQRYCREHMLEAFRKGFLGFNEDMVVFYPSLEFKRGGYVYQYRVLEDVPEKFRSDKTGLMLTSALGSISGNCARCGRPANVAYFGPGSFQWVTTRRAGVKIEYPNFDEVVVQPEILCRECVVDHVAYSLLNFDSQFAEGIVLPYKGKGVMLPGVV